MVPNRRGTVDDAQYSVLARDYTWGPRSLQGLAMAEAAWLTGYSAMCGTSNVFGASQTIWDNLIYVKPGRRYRLLDISDIAISFIWSAR
jgi:hypothetical protein